MKANLLPPSGEGKVTDRLLTCGGQTPPAPVDPASSAAGASEPHARSQFVPPSWRWRGLVASGVNPAEDDVEVGLEGFAVFGDLPTSGDRVLVVAEARGETLREWPTLTPKPPLSVSDAHLIDATDPPFVGVQLEVGSVGGIASDDGDVVGELRKFCHRALYQMRT